MAFSDVFEKLGRAIFESPFESKRLAQDAPELAEIRLAAIDAIKAKSHGVGGTNVFPYDVVRVHLLGVPAEQETVFQSQFLRSYFADELKTALTRSSYRFPGTLAVELTTTPRLPSPEEKWLSIETLMRQPVARPGPSQTRPAMLTVIKGQANQHQISLEKPRTNIGRTVEVFRGAGPSRRNDLAFSGDAEADQSVSREHAHIIRVTESGEYRLFNDRSYKGDGNCGLWIVREGLSNPVHRSARGTLLKAGDEIHLGTAVLRFWFGEEGCEPAAADPV